jgi:hypothetical protein
MNGAHVIDLLWALTFFIAVASEVLSGAIRYYASMAGAAQLAYLPKLMTLMCIVIILVRRPKVSHFLVALYMAAATCVSLSNGLTLAATGFWMWTVSPMIFAMLAPPAALVILNGRVARIAFLALAVLCMGGVIANYFTHWPWVGANASVAGFNLHMSKASCVGGVSRLTGFGRDSAATGLMIGLLTTWLLPRFRQLAVRALVLAAAAVAIWLTTNKTTLIALLFVVALNRLARPLTMRKACMWVAAIMVLLPLGAYALTLALNRTELGSGSLASLQDRIVNTWPLLLEGLLRENVVWFGTGPGGFGSATSYYPGSFGFNVGYADNLALYAMANFGVFGALLLTVLLAKCVIACQTKDKAVWVMLLFLLASGITTDICESLGCLLFLGITIKSVWLGAHQLPSLPRTFDGAPPRSAPRYFRHNTPAFDPKLGGEWHRSRSDLENVE